jgi:hypothetical protein
VRFCTAPAQQIEILVSKTTPPQHSANPRLRVFMITPLQHNEFRVLYIILSQKRNSLEINDAVTVNEREKIVVAIPEEKLLITSDVNDKTLLLNTTLPDIFSTTGFIAFEL